MSRPIPVEQMLKEFKSFNKTSHLFKIDNFSLLKKYNLKMVESSVFDLGGHKWKLILYPNENGYVSIFLVNQVSINAKLQFQLFVIKQIQQIQKIWHSTGKEDFGISSISQKRGASYFISLADLEKKGYLIEDCCIFGVKLFGTENAKSGTAECFSLIEKPLNHRVTFEMASYSILTLGVKVHYSTEFVVGNRKWRIEVHPKGFDWEEDKSFSVYLLGQGFIDNALKTNTFAKFKLRVLDQVNKDHLEKTYSDWISAEHVDHYGFADFMPLKKLNLPYLMNDVLYVGIDFEVISTSNYC
uniref:Ubiquitin carboxyl-terminal hydrolase 13 n=1 Tax=Noccaea caerulescens TaxID=107243 RepID=A0A1J3DPG0_NOCCA